MIDHTKYPGLIPDSPEVLEMLHARVLPRIHFLLEELPEEVDLSDGLPPAKTQILPDCACWAVGYYHKTYDEGIEMGWDVNLPEHQFSPSYIYNQIRGARGGSSALSAYGLLKDDGCCTLSNFPQTTNDDLLPTEDQKEMAKPYKISSCGLFYASELHNWREILASGRLLTISVPYNTYFAHPSSPHYIIDNGSNYRNHQVTVCGYSFNIEGTGKSGFKFINCRGTGYGNNGYAWVTEKFIEESNSSAYYMQDLTTPPTSFHAVGSTIEWDGPTEEWTGLSSNTYDIYKETYGSFNLIDTVTALSYGPVANGTYGIGAYGSEMVETTAVVGDDCPAPSCAFELTECVRCETIEVI